MYLCQFPPPHYELIIISKMTPLIKPIQNNPLIFYSFLRNTQNNLHSLFQFPVNCILETRPHAFEWNTLHNRIEKSFDDQSFAIFFRDTPAL